LKGKNAGDGMETWDFDLKYDRCSSSWLKRKKEMISERQEYCVEKLLATR